MSALPCHGHITVDRLNVNLEQTGTFSTGLLKSDDKQKTAILKTTRGATPNADSQTSEVLITNLCNAELYPKNPFGELYHQHRWIEAGYKALKYPAEKYCADLENWSGRSLEVIYQNH